MLLAVGGSRILALGTYTLGGKRDTSNGQQCRMKQRKGYKRSKKCTGGGDIYSQYYLRQVEMLAESKTRGRKVTLGVIRLVEKRGRGWDWAGQFPWIPIKHMNQCFFTMKYLDTSFYDLKSKTLICLNVVCWALKQKKNVSGKIVWSSQWVPEAGGGG